jgi:hypothetical protein
MTITPNIHTDAKTKQALYKSLASHLSAIGWEVRLTPEENGFRLTARTHADKEGVWYPRDILEAIRILQALTF